MKRNLATALLVTSLLAPAFAQAAGPLLTTIDADVMIAMQRDLHLTESQVIERLFNEEKASKLARQLTVGIGKDFGGAWLSDNGATLHVAVTSPDRFADVTQAGATPVLVKRSVAQLRDVHHRIDGIAFAFADMVVATSEDLANNRIVVEAKPKHRLAVENALRKQLGTDIDAIVVVDATHAVREHIDVIGGNGFGVNRLTCSIGFSVNGGFVTAGHCGAAGSTTKSPNGVVQGSSFPDNDYAWVQVSPGNTPLPYVTLHNGTNQTINGSVEAPVGASICHSGYTSGVECGTIRSRSGTVHYDSGNVVRGMIVSDACSRPGDSGGPAFRGDQAQGVTSGGSVDPVPGGCGTDPRSYFQPVNEILQVYHLTLATLPPPTVTDNVPLGWFDSAQAVKGGISLAGWAMDPDSSPLTNPSLVDVTLDGVAQSPITANTYRGDVGAAYPGYGDYHGWGTVLSAANGQHTVCATARNVVPAGATTPAQNTSLGCKTVSVGIVDHAPVGSFESLQTVNGSLRIVGWTMDEDSAPRTTPLDVYIYVDGAENKTSANRYRPDVGSAYPGAGDYHGFDFTPNVQAGTHTVCIWVLNVQPAGAGNTADHLNLGCRTATLGGQEPTGSIVSVLSNRCIDVQNGSSANGTPVQMWDCNGTAAQRWTTTSSNTVMAMGKCLDIVNFGTANRTPVQLWDCTGAGNQKWIPQGNSTLLNPQSGRCLEIIDFNVNNGAPLAIQDCHGYDNQRWVLP